MTLAATAAHLERAYTSAKLRHKQRRVIARKRSLITARILVKELRENGHHVQRWVDRALRTT